MLTQVRTGIQRRAGLRIDRKAREAARSVRPARKHQRCALTAALRASRQLPQSVARCFSAPPYDQRGQGFGRIAPADIAIEPEPARRSTKLSERGNRAGYNAIARPGGVFARIAASAHRLLLAFGAKYERLAVVWRAQIDRQRIDVKFAKAKSLT